MVTVVQQVDPTGATCEEKCQEGHIGLGRVAFRAGEHQVVGPVIGRLAAARPDMVERDPLFLGPYTTIGANRSVKTEEPFAMFLVGSTAGAAKLG